MPETFAIAIPAGIVNASRKKSVLDQIETVRIIDDATYLLMGDLLKAVKTLQVEVNETFDAVIAAGDKAHKAALAAKRIHSEPLLRGEVLAKSKLRTRDDEIRTAREKQEAADRKAREEFERAERQAREEEEEARRQAEMSLQLALEAEESGNVNAADEHLADAAKAEGVAVVIPRPAPPPAFRPLPSPPKIAGVSSREEWHWKVTDLSLVPRQFLMLNETMLNTFTRTTKGAQTVPGIEFFSEQVIYSGKFK